MHFAPDVYVVVFILLRMETPLHGRSGGHTGPPLRFRLGGLYAERLVGLGGLRVDGWLRLDRLRADGWLRLDRLRADV